MKFANPLVEIQSEFYPLGTMKIKMNPLEKWKCENNPFYNPFDEK